MEAANVGNPFVISGKLDVMLNAIPVNGVHAEATGHYKRVVFAGKTFLQNSLPTFNGPLAHPPFKKLFFARFQWNKLLEVAD